MKNKLGPLVENVTESTAACLLTMVQGNILALTLGHWLIASQTGIVAGALTSAVLMATNAARRWAVALLLGAITTVVDFFTHPGMFGSVALEAVVTGAAAGLISTIVGRVVSLVKRLKAAHRRASGPG